MTTSFRIVYAEQNDTIDALCWRHLGITRRVVEQTFLLNPELLSFGPVLPHRTAVVLPQPIATTAIKPTVKLWD